uniref:Uncharacterized protein n=1 Tax=Moniliophthora roreri TaxID=221103 RepID=A0A0W0F2K9_MONRR
MAEPDTPYNMGNYNKDVIGYFVCVVRSDRDPDMQGYAVRLSAFVANVCIAILITWSEEEVRSSVSLVLLQTYTILLATAVSLIHHNLSIADAHFTLTITISPLGVYFVYSLYRDVIAVSHRWLFFLFISIFYLSWGSSLVIWEVDMRVWYHEVLLSTITRNPEKYKSQLPARSFDPLGYGQLLAIAVIIEPLYAVLRLSILRRREIGRWLFLQLPKSLWHGIVFIITGKRNPWKTIQEKRLLDESKDGNVYYPNGLDFGELPISKRSPGVYKEKWSNENLELGKTVQVTFPRTGSSNSAY